MVVLSVLLVFVWREVKSHQNFWEAILAVPVEVGW